MITRDELAALEQIEEHETDFYASLMFLTLTRLHPETSRDDLVAAVLSAYDDLNERTAMTDGDDS